MAGSVSGEVAYYSALARELSSRV